MDQNFQTEFQTSLFKKYQGRAFEAFALYTFWGGKFSIVEKEMAGYKARSAEAMKKALELRATGKKEDRDQAKLLEEDAGKFDELVKSIGPIYNKLMDQATAYQKEAMESLEQAEIMKDFKLNTPEEIDAQKKAAAEAKLNSPAPVDPAAAVTAAPVAESPAQPAPEGSVVESEVLNDHA